MRQFQQPFRVIDFLSSAMCKTSLQFYVQTAVVLPASTEDPSHYNVPTASADERTPFVHPRICSGTMPAKQHTAALTERYKPHQVQTVLHNEPARKVCVLNLLDTYCWGSSASIVIRVNGWTSEEFRSTPGRGTRLFSSPVPSDRSWDNPMCTQARAQRSPSTTNEYCHQSPLQYIPEE